MKKKQSRNIYYKYLNIENIYSMWEIVKSTCKNKKDIYYFSLNLYSNIYEIYNNLTLKTYIPNNYKLFLIYEPKVRLVMSQSIRDKIINHFVTNFYLIPYLERKLIDSNVATRVNKGSSYASKLLRGYFNELKLNKTIDEIYCLKIDISKYFYNIDHKLLIEMLKRDIKDNDVIELLFLIIKQVNKEYVRNTIRKFNYKFKTDIPLYDNNKGLSIGAMSSQFLAIYYLSDLDHFIKEKLKCKYYIRYMDDMLILDTDKSKLLAYKRLIEIELDKLHLKMNKKSNIFKCSKGFEFLGFKYIFKNNKLYCFCNKATTYKINSRLSYLYEFDKYSYKKSLASYYGYYKNVYKLKDGDFKVKSIELYNSFKERYKDSIILIKEGIFYKTFNEDAKILWYLYSYKLVNDSCSFGINSYDKVISDLKEKGLGLKIVSRENELLEITGDRDIYMSYRVLANKKFSKNFEEKVLIDKIKDILKEHPELYEKIDEYLDNII